MSEKTITHNKEENAFYFECPHCNLLIQVPQNEIRCTIFRHANYKTDMAFVPPHAPKSQCDFWVANGLVWGCGKPFKFDGQKVVKCDYI